MAINIKEYAEEGLRECRDRYLQDLEPLTHEQLASKPGSVDRSAYDFTYEIIYVNGRFMKRLRGEDPGPPIEGWVYAPEDFCDKEKATVSFRASMDEAIEYFESLTPEDYETELVLPSTSWSRFKVATFLAKHVNYHDGQLNYLQALGGDGEVHWS